MDKMKTVVHQTNEMILQSVNTQFPKVNTTITNMSVDGNSKFSEMTESFTAIEARLAILEDSDKRTHTKKQHIDELHQTLEDHKKTRAVATGFHENTTEQEASE